MEAKKTDIDNYRNYLKRHTSEEAARDKICKKKGITICKRNPLARKENKSETYISQYSVELYSNLIKRFYLWLYNRDNLVKGKVPKLVAHLQKTNRGQY